MYVPSFHWLLVSLIYKGEYAECRSVPSQVHKSCKQAEMGSEWCQHQHRVQQCGQLNIVSQLRIFNPPHYWQQEEDTGQLHARSCSIILIVKLRRGSGKDWQGMAVKAKGLKA